MTLYSGMNNTSGKVITDIDHLRQSVRDILLTPQGSRIARREYGSLLSALIISHKIRHYACRSCRQCMWR